MAENDSNTVKPVDSVQNIPILTPTGRREQRRNRRQPQGEKTKIKEQEQDNLDEEQSLDGEIFENENERSASGGIDYCA